jgi:hypothetical protein
MCPLACEKYILLLFFNSVRVSHTFLITLIKQKTCFSYAKRVGSTFKDLIKEILTV